MMNRNALIKKNIANLVLHLGYVKIEDKQHLLTFYLDLTEIIIKKLNIHETYNTIVFYYICIFTLIWNHEIEHSQIYYYDIRVNICKRLITDYKIKLSFQKIFKTQLFVFKLLDYKFPYNDLFDYYKVNKCNIPINLKKKWFKEIQEDYLLGHQPPSLTDSELILEDKVYFQDAIPIQKDIIINDFRINIIIYRNISFRKLIEDYQNTVSISDFLYPKEKRNTTSVSDYL